jgi:hypothetical protein
MPQQVFHTDDFFYCIEATSGSQSPSANPEKWQRLSIPADLVDCIALRATAALLPVEGRGDEVASMLAAAQASRNQTVNEAVQRDGNARPMKVVCR